MNAPQDYYQILEQQKQQLQETMFILRKTFINTKYWIQNLSEDLLKRIPPHILQKNLSEFHVEHLEILQNPDAFILHLESQKDEVSNNTPTKQHSKSKLKSQIPQPQRQIRKALPQGLSGSSKKVIKTVGSHHKQFK